MRVGRQTYSVPSRLMGHVVEARRYPDTIENLYRDKSVEVMPRIRGDGAARIEQIAPQVAAGFVLHAP